MPKLQNTDGDRREGDASATKRPNARLVNALTEVKYEHTALPFGLLTTPTADELRKAALDVIQHPALVKFCAEPKSTVTAKQGSSWVGPLTTASDISPTTSAI